jgi:regulator of protease activity HflC (stomatin/prohibitin superfamily)
VEQAQQDAASMVARERGKGEAEKANAEGQAQALRIRGAAEAEYNARVAQSLSPVLIQQQYLQKWNGQLPQYQLGGSGALINLPSPK